MFKNILMYQVIYVICVSSAKEVLGWLNPPYRFVEEKYNQSNSLCMDKDNTKRPSQKYESPTDTSTIILDVIYSIGILSLGLSPWAYIKFTRSFEENLWINPWRIMEEKFS